MILVALAALALTGCPPPKQAARTPGQAGDPDRGRRLYIANCTACHAMDPAKEGALGPAVKGSSKELLQARVVDGTYPPGYTPKKPTDLMKPLPQMADGIDDLAAYLE